MTVITNQNQFNNLINESFNEMKHDPANILPDELVLEVFSRLTLATLGAICSISKEWERLASDPILLKKTIYREIAFGNAKWAQYFGKDAIKDEDNKDEWSSLPWKDFIEDCKKFKSLFPEKQAKDTLMLVRLPKTLNGELTLKNLGELIKKHFPKSDTNLSIPSIIVDKLKDKSIDKSRWVLMTTDVLPESRKKDYNEQQRIVAELVNYEVPEILTSATCILSQYIHSQIRLFSDNPLTYTRCKEKVEDDQTIVGSFEAPGLQIDYIDNEATDAIGIAALQKF